MQMSGAQGRSIRNANNRHNNKKNKSIFWKKNFKKKKVQGHRKERRDAIDAAEE